MSEEHKLKLLPLELSNALTKAAIDLLSEPNIVLVTDKLKLTYHHITTEAKITILAQHTDHGYGYVINLHFDDDMNLIVTNHHTGEFISYEEAVKNISEL